MRVVTPGTVTDEAFLDARRDTLLGALYREGPRFGIAWLELSSGRFSVMEAAGEEALAAEIERLRPAELLVPESSHPVNATTFVRERPLWHFDLDSCTRLLCEQFATRDLSGFGCAEYSLAIRAAGGLLQYVRDTQKAALPHLRGLRTEERSEAVLLDAATRRNLELDISLTDRPECTLAAVLDQTATAMGGRELRRWLHRPSARSRRRRVATASHLHVDRARAAGAAA